jgi:hypothetical protein
MNIKQKNEAKKNFIFRALQNGYSVKRNDDGTYTFTRDKSEGDEPLKTFVNRCNIKLNFTNFR